jgi:type IV fimbrial biogenesis protein FimT
MRQLTKAQHGFTLIELGVTIAVIGLLALAALPSFAGYLANAKLRETANVVMANAMWTRNEAIKLNTTATLTVTDQALQVSTIENGDEKVLRSLPLNGTIRATNLVASFDSSGRLTPFGSELSLSLTPTKFACSEDIRCPSVRFDAGGAVSLCTKGDCP